jgi:hypothetical protein
MGSPNAPLPDNFEALVKEGRIEKKPSLSAKDCRVMTRERAKMLCQSGTITNGNDTAFQFFIATIPFQISPGSNVSIGPNNFYRYCPSNQEVKDPQTGKEACFYFPSIPGSNWCALNRAD